MVTITFEILDVGCGDNPRGSVNVDFRYGCNYGRSLTRADLIASAEYLPFRDKSFSRVTSGGLLHHLREPERAWAEMVRVSKGSVDAVEPGWPVWPQALTGVPLDSTETVHHFSYRQLRKIVGSARIRRIVKVGVIYHPLKLPVFYSRFRVET